jgi:hypothetical protein
VRGRAAGPRAGDTRASVGFGSDGAVELSVPRPDQWWVSSCRQVRPGPLSGSGRPTGSGFVQSSSTPQSTGSAAMPASTVGAPTKSAVVVAASRPAHRRWIRNHYREPSRSAHFLDVPPGRLPRPVHPGSGGRLLPGGQRRLRDKNGPSGPKSAGAKATGLAFPSGRTARWVSTRSTIPRRLRTATPRPDPTPEHSTPARADQTPWCMGPQGHRISRELQTGRAATHCREQVFIVWMGSTIGAHGVSWPVG